MHIYQRSDVKRKKVRNLVCCGRQESSGYCCNNESRGAAGRVATSSDGCERILCVCGDRETGRRAHVFQLCYPSCGMLRIGRLGAGKSLSTEESRCGRDAGEMRWRISGNLIVLMMSKFPSLFFLIRQVAGLDQIEGRSGDSLDVD